MTSSRRHSSSPSSLAVAERRRLAREVAGAVRGEPLEGRVARRVQQDAAAFEIEDAVAAFQRHRRPLLGDDDGAVELDGEVEERLGSPWDRAATSARRGAGARARARGRTRGRRAAAHRPRASPCAARRDARCPPRRAPRARGARCAPAASPRSRGRTRPRSRRARTRPGPRDPGRATRRGPQARPGRRAGCRGRRSRPCPRSGRRGSAGRARERPQQRRLPGARRAEHRDDLPGLDAKRDVRSDGAAGYEKVRPSTRTRPISPGRL